MAVAWKPEGFCHTLHRTNRYGTRKSNQIDTYRIKPTPHKRHLSHAVTASSRPAANTKRISRR